jgi:hypothetical protein
LTPIVCHAKMLANRVGVGTLPLTRLSVSSEAFVLDALGPIPEALSSMSCL